MDKIVNVKIGSQNYVSEIVAENHLIISDYTESPDEMGVGAGPSAILLGSLGACTAMTLMMYSKRKGWNLTNVSIDLEYKQKANNQNPETIIERKIVIDGDLSDEQKSKLLELAKACPVHKIITNKVLVEDKLDTMSIL